jgi:hypothetical protein
MRAACSLTICMMQDAPMMTIPAMRWMNSAQIGQHCHELPAVNQVTHDRSIMVALIDQLSWWLKVPESTLTNFILMYFEWYFPVSA